MKKMVLFVGLIMVCTVEAQLTGPVLPCTDCQPVGVKTMPYSGSWFNPEQSGSGLIMDFQNGILQGYYFGYNASGDPVWAIFSGQLEDASDSGAMWRLTAPLNRFRDGACLNCDYAFPTADGNLGEIELTFNRIAHASFRVNGGDEQHIVPLYFGYENQAFFPEQTNYRLPELEGWWTVYIDLNDEGPDNYSYISYMVYLGKSRIASNGNYHVSSTYFPSAPEALHAGTIRCVPPTSDGQVHCDYEINLLSTDPYAFKINMADMSSKRIYGETENGDTVELLRTSSDLCMRPNEPDGCPNTGLYGSDE